MAWTKWYYNGGFNDKGLYVHLHSRNLGKGYPRKGRQKEQQITGDNVKNIFINYRTQVQDALLKQLKRQVISSLKKKDGTQLSDKELELINEAFDKTSPSEYLKQLDEQLKPLFEKQVNKELIASVHEQYNNLNSDVVFSKLVDSAETSCEELDKLLTIISDTARLFKGKGRNLATCLLTAKKQKTKNGENPNFDEKIANVYSALNDFIQKENGTALNIKGAREVAKQIQRSLNKIQELRINKEGKTLKELTRSLGVSLNNNLFATYFGEWAGAKVKKLGKNEANRIVSTIITGDKKVTATYYDADGNISNPKESSGWSQQQKTDFILNTDNIIFKIGENEFETYFSIGVSNKFYRTKNLDAAGSSKMQDYEFGGGGSLNEAVTALTIGHVKEMYIAYNLIQHPTKKLAPGFQEFKRTLIMRQLLTFFSSRNKEDFAQLFLLNGQVVSIYEILMNVFENNKDILEGKEGTSSIIESDERGNSIIKLSEDIKGMSPPVYYDEDSAFKGGLERNERVHTYMKNKKLQGVIRLNNLLAARSNS